MGCQWSCFGLEYNDNPSRSDMEHEENARRALEKKVAELEKRLKELEKKDGEQE